MKITKGRLFVALVVGVFLFLLIAGQLAMRISSGTVLELTISGLIAEEDWPDFNARLWEGDVTVLRDLTTALDRARTDDRIAGVSLRIKSFAMSFAKMQELRDRLLALTKAGKFCAAFLEEPDNRGYYLASACPEIHLLPKSELFLTGLMGHTTFRRGTLDKLEVVPDFLHIGEYKSAPNIWTEKKYTPEHREIVVDLLTGWQQQIVAGIAAGRKIPPATVEALVRGGPYLSQEGLEKKLVDRLSYGDEYRESLKARAGTDELETISAGEYLRRTPPLGGARIAIVHATGILLTGRSGYEGGELILGSDTVAGALRQAGQDDSIKAIVFRVDSPGGSPVASEIIRRELRRAKEKKPVVASMSDVAASGGYWISMSANKIVAQPGTVTGSIGVWVGKLNIRGLYEKLGLSKDYVALAPNATLFYPFESFTPEQRQQVMRFMQDIYRNFLEGVSEGRKLKVEDVDRIARGRVWLGARAREIGLVDELGGLDRAVTLARELAQIPPDASIEYVIYPKPKSTFEQFAEWLETGLPAGSGLKARFDPARALLFREPAAVLLPFEVEPR